MNLAVGKPVNQKLVEVLSTLTVPELEFVGISKERKPSATECYRGLMIAIRTRKNECQSQKTKIHKKRRSGFFQFEKLLSKKKKTKVSRSLERRGIKKGSKENYGVTFLLYNGGCSVDLA